jgi:mono/diheme cytochrome c family protein
VNRIILSIAAAYCICAQAQNAGGPAGNAENGKKLWVKDNCYTCHGYDGHGGAGARLAPKPIAMAAFIAIVRHPPASSMPTFSEKVIPDSDLRDMWAYLHSIPAAPAAKDVPLLNP